MGRIVFLLEEPSMVECLRGILPKVFPSWVENVDWVPIPHKGKSDLHKSIPRKLSAWREPNVRFVILRDNDSGDCIALKAHLRKLANARSEDEVLIRIVCQELESWLLGDLKAIKGAYPKALVQPDRLPQKLRDPDRLGNAAQELAHITGTQAKVLRAGLIAGKMNPSENRSYSFNIFLSGLRQLCTR